VRLQPHRRLSPDLHNAPKFIDSDRVDFPRRPIDPILTGLPFDVVGDIVGNGLLALTGLCKNMHQAEIVHFLSRVGPAAQHKPLRLGGTDFPREEYMRADTGEHAEDMIRE